MWNKHWTIYYKIIQSHIKSHLILFLQIILMAIGYHQMNTHLTSQIKVEKEVYYLNGGFIIWLTETTSKISCCFFYIQLLQFQKLPNKRPIERTWLIDRRIDKFQY